MKRSRLHLIPILALMALVQVREAAAQQTVAEKVDIVFLFDDTVSFLSYLPDAQAVVQDLVSALEAARPEVDFAFGIARFEDYGGPGWTYCSGVRPCEEDRELRINGRPFILNQPLITALLAGGREVRDGLLASALTREGPGFGGDDPEPAVGDALFQLATGAGFDGNGDGIRTGLSGDQVAGGTLTQENPDESGDVPPFSSLILPTSGSVGGVGFRPDALKLVILATDICSATAFPAGSTIPPTITGRYSQEQTGDFACRNTEPGTDRFGFVGTAKSAVENTQPGAVSPLGAATLPEVIKALNDRDIRVIGIGPGVTPRPAGSGPSFEPAVFLSALARITGAVDRNGTPLVFDVSNGSQDLQLKVLESIVETADRPENPGCQDRDLTTTVNSLKNSLQTQNRNALRSVKKLRAADVSKAQIRSRRVRVMKAFEQANRSVDTFPLQTTVCASLACQATDHSADVNSVRSNAKILKKQSRSSNKAVMRNANSRTSSAAKRRMASARRAFRATLNALNDLPAVTNQCSAA